MTVNRAEDWNAFTWENGFLYPEKTSKSFDMEKNRTHDLPKKQDSMMITYKFMAWTVALALLFGFILMVIR